MDAETLRKTLRSEKAVIGTAVTLKMLKKEELAKIYIAHNCPENTKSDIMHYSKIANIEVEELGVLNNELGTICKKPFSVSVVGLMK